MAPVGPVGGPFVRGVMTALHGARAGGCPAAGPWVCVGWGEALLMACTLLGPCPPSLLYELDKHTRANHPPKVLHLYHPQFRTA